MKLFIYGNGFDKHHEMRTLYSDFRNYLFSKYSIKKNSKEYKYHAFNGFHTNWKRIEDYNYESWAAFFVSMIDSVELESKKVSNKGKKQYNFEWSVFEEYLGMIDWLIVKPYYFDGVDCNEEDYFDLANRIKESCDAVKKFFVEWVSTIKINFSKKDSAINDFLQKNDFQFLSFNYTETLELLYGIENVEHIHGKRGNDNLIFGHNKEIDNWLDVNSEYCANDSRSVLLRCSEEFLKKTNEIISHSSFFKQLKDIEEIYFYGFGFGDVDLPYLQKIRKSCTQKLKIYINNYDFKRKYAYISNQLKKCGFTFEKIFNLNL